MLGTVEIVGSYYYMYCLYSPPHGVVIDLDIFSSKVPLMDHKPA